MDFKAHLSAWEEIQRSCFKLGIAFSGCKLIAKLETNSRGQKLETSPKAYLLREEKGPVSSPGAPRAGPIQPGVGD